MIKTVEFLDNGFVLLIDQTKLPTEEIIVECKTYKEVADAIVTMIVRGAPAIGVTAAGGIALGVRDIKTDSLDEFKKEFNEILKVLGATRPTAVNLFWAIERMKKVAGGNGYSNADELRVLIIKEAENILKDDIAINEKMGFNGEVVIDDGDTILTHCNAGALATAGHYGTALGVIKAAFVQGKKIKVFADETRPFLQGARLTAWEMMKEGIDVTLITDNMAGYFMQKGMINKIIVGADRIAANGDAANKIGTYSVAILAKEHNIPLYITAPMSTIDFNTADGSGIPIEERPTLEVSHVKGQQIAPTGVKILNPAFDVTPNRLIAGIITEKGIAKAPFKESLKTLQAG